MSRAVKYPNKDPQKLAEDIWIVDGTWKNKFARRMTVVRGSTGEVLVHNAMQLNEKHLEWLSSLGPVDYILAPNKFHCSELYWMAQQFPKAQLIFPNSMKSDFQKQGLIQFKSTEESICVAGSIDLIPIEGLKIEEVAIYHRSSKSLVLCDLCFNMPDVFTGLEKLFMNLNKVGGRFGPSRILKYVFTKDKIQLLNFVKQLSAKDIDRVVVNHGDVFLGNGGVALSKGFSEIF